MKFTMPRLFIRNSVPLSTSLTRYALVHISEMAWTRTNVEDLVAIGDEVDVKIIKIGEKGRVDASMKALLPRPQNQSVTKR